MGSQSRRESKNTLKIKERLTLNRKAAFLQLNAAAERQRKTGGEDMEGYVQRYRATFETQNMLEGVLAQGGSVRYAR